MSVPSMKNDPLRPDYAFNVLLSMLFVGPAAAALAWGWPWLLLYVVVALIMGL